MLTHASPDRRASTRSAPRSKEHAARQRKASATPPTGHSTAAPAASALGWVAATTKHDYADAQGKAKAPNGATTCSSSSHRATETRELWSDAPRPREGVARARTVAFATAVAEHADQL